LPNGTSWGKFKMDLILKWLRKLSWLKLPESPEQLVQGSRSNLLKDPTAIGKQFGQVRQEHIVDAVLLLTIWFLGYSLLSDLESSLDLAFSDESNYMFRGLHLSKISIKPEDSPLYSVWYYILHNIQPNSVSLYYLNWKITTLLPVLLFYLTLRVHKTGFVISLLFSMFLLFAQFNITLWPRVSNFCICFILAGFIVFNIPKDKFNKFYWLSVFTFFISYIRPEFFISFTLSVVAAFYYFFRSVRRIDVVRNVHMMLLVAVTLLVKLFYGFPMFEKGSERVMVAFGQHFVVNKFLRESIWGIDPWTNWEKYFYPVFGYVNSIADVLLSNPKEFYRHFEFNVYWFTTINYAVVKDFLTPYWFFKTDIGLGTSFAVLMMLLLVSYKFIFQKLRNGNFRKLVSEKLAFLIFLIPCILSCLVIFPRQHYNYMINIIVVSIILISIQPILNNLLVHIKFKKLYLYLTLLSISCYVANLKIKSGDYFQSKSLPVKETVNYLNSYHTKINLLGNEDGISVFLKDNFSCISASGKNTDFFGFLNTYSINMIWVTESLLVDKRFAADKVWLDFLLHHERYGFKKHLKSGMEGYLLVKVK